VLPFPPLTRGFPFLSRSSTGTFNHILMGGTGGFSRGSANDVRALRKEEGFNQEGFADAYGLHRTI
jgi:hypothetical protein